MLLGVILAGLQDFVADNPMTAYAIAAVLILLLILALYLVNARSGAITFLR